MTGADAPALRALAGQMSQSAGQLDRMRQTIRARVYSISWQGLDGAHFRRAWDSQHGPMLTHVADGLRASAQRLLREADQQEGASRAGAGAPGIALPGGPASVGGGDLGKAFIKGFDGFLTLSGAFLSLMQGMYGKEVRGYWRDGRWVNKYHRWASGKADFLNRTLGTAKQVDKVGKLLPLVGGIFDFSDQWQDAGGDYNSVERGARAGGAAAAMYGVDWAITGGFTLLGSVVPGVGTAVGAGVGMAVSAYVTTRFEDEISGAGAWAGSRVYDGGEFLVDAGQAAVDYGGEVLASGKDLLEAGGGLAVKAGDEVGDFFTGVTSWALR
jgi:uncharacterized protein YukE